MKTVLYIDNNLALIDDMALISDSLGLKLVHASTLEKARETMARTPPQLVIFEIDLPDGDGIEFCHEIRKNKDFSKVGVILLSEKTDAYIQVIAFEAGADDYLIKPINKRLTQARLKSILRRINGHPASAKSNELHINREKFLVEYKGREISLPRKEFEILSLLFNNKGKVYNRDKIKEEIWINKGSGVNSRTVDVHIKNIREIIGPKFIKTIKGVGYKFVS
ncbi:MAG TPA: response regulator transcription factor [Flavobacteriales bacterium]|nr:response regulator transcription factor [Flavobacteriales bacterium]